MKKINCLIADDEQLAREIMENYVRRLDKLNLAARCSNGAEVYNALSSQSFDLLFLDIQMPQLTGIELLRTLKNPPAVILTTAYREYALEGYEFNVIDYLLKPISFERFLKAVDKYESWIHPGRGIMGDTAPETAGNQDAFMYVKADKKMTRVALTDLLYIEGVKDYVKLHLVNKTIITYQTLTYFEEKLSANHFVRTHRSYIVSLKHIDAYTATQVEIGKVSLPIGTAYGKEAMKRLEC
jgi:DNA-binding LytR/AlgR family response regulator